MNSEDDDYERACYVIQKGVYDYIDKHDSEKTPQKIVDMLGGCAASIFHECYTPDSKNDFLEALTQRFNDIIETLEKDESRSDPNITYIDTTTIH